MIKNKNTTEQELQEFEQAFEMLSLGGQTDFSVNEKIGLALLNNSVHFLTGVIHEVNIEQTIKWITYENLTTYPEDMSKKVLTLYINSPGGSLNDSLALIDVMRSSKIPIRTVGMGQIVSAAFLIFSAGTKGERYIFKNTSIMCHQFSGEIYGKHHDIKAHIKEFELSNDRMLNVLQDTTGLDIRTIKTKLLPPTDVWLTPKELIKLHVADKLI
jgi:ATP-dependent Clp protease protease subunit